MAPSLERVAGSCEGAMRGSGRTRQQRQRRLQRSLVLLVGLSFVTLWFRKGNRGVTEEEALARVIRSEIGVGNPKQKRHVGWATRNLSSERGQSIAAMACSPCGTQGRGRPVASWQEATEEDRALAREILSAPQSADPTGGATHFMNPLLQDRLARQGHPGYRGRSYRKVRRTWIRSYGWRPYYRIGNELELWGPRKGARTRGRSVHSP